MESAIGLGEIAGFYEGQHDAGHERPRTVVLTHGGELVQGVRAAGIHHRYEYAFAYVFLDSH